MTTPRRARAGPYEVGRVYRITEVLGWWLQHLCDRPEWFPVTGRLHEDKAFFNLHEHHYHVDARFLSVRHENAAKLKSLRQSPHVLRKWHRSAQEILARFPMPHDRNWHFVIKDGLTRLVPNVEMRFEEARPGGTTRRTKPRERKRLTRSETWGRERIRTRRVERVYLRPLPEIPIGTSENKPAHTSILEPFQRLRDRFPNAEGDTCPHRGYDLRTVPIGADGYRQCPLHQLRVRAPE